MEKSKLPKKTSDKGMEAYAKYSGLTFQVLIYIGLFTFAGIKADEWLEFKFPVFTILSSILSVASGLYYLIKRMLE